MIRSSQLKLITPSAEAAGEMAMASVYSHDYNFTPTNLSPSNAGRGESLTTDVESR